MSLLITLGLAAALIQSPVPAQTAACSGQVLEDGSRAPIAGAQVTLIPERFGPVYRFGPVSDPFPDRPSTAITDQNGRYQFHGVGEGRYRISVHKAGFAPLSGPEITEVDLRAGERREGVDLTLQRGAVIVGRVLDEAGEPLIHAQVMAMSKPPVPAGTSFRRDSLIPRGPSAQTNDLGEFRLFGLAPGEYYVQAVSRPDPGGSPAPRDTTMLPTYFPGTSDSGAAQPITVGAGQTSADVVIRMIVAPAFQVSGVVRDEAGRPVSNAMVRLEMDGSTRQPMFMMGRWNQSRTDTSGTFTITNVTSGTYTLLAVAPVVISGPPRAQSTGAARRWGSANESGGYTTFVGLGVAGGPNGVTTETSNGMTIQYRDDTATRVPITVNEANVTGLEVIVRPTPP